MCEVRADLRVVIAKQGVTHPDHINERSLDVVVITETWLGVDDTIALCELPHHTVLNIYIYIYIHIYIYIYYDVSKQVGK